MTLNPQALTEAALLPCPFCGGAGKLTDAGPDYWVFCGRCSAQGAFAEGSDTDHVVNNLARTKAIAAWNARALSALPPINEGIVERLRAIDEAAMYEAPATTHATVNEAADIIERLSRERT